MGLEQGRGSRDGVSFEVCSFFGERVTSGLNRTKSGHGILMEEGGGYFVMGGTMTEDSEGERSNFATWSNWSWSGLPCSSL